MGKNCWEFMLCGREPRGKYVGNNPCPVSTDKRLDGTHGGKNAGRACWAVAGSMCGKLPSGINAEVHGNCGSCEFYLSVRAEEPSFKFSATLISFRGNVL